MLSRYSFNNLSQLFDRAFNDSFLFPKDLIDMSQTTQKFVPSAFMCETKEEAEELLAKLAPEEDNHNIMEIGRTTYSLNDGNSSFRGEFCKISETESEKAIKKKRYDMLKEELEQLEKQLE